MTERELIRSLREQLVESCDCDEVGVDLDENCEVCGSCILVEMIDDGLAGTGKAKGLMESIEILVPTRHTDFGDQCILDTPLGAEAVVLSRNIGRGLEPFTLCLDHQVYTKKIEAAMEGMSGLSINTIVAIPVRSGEYINVAVKGNQGTTNGEHQA